MNFNNDEDLLASINRLLERLHQAGGENFSSQITIVNVAPGAQYVNQIGTQIFGTDKSQEPKPESSPTEDPSKIPASLATDEAMILWQKAQEAGYLDAHYQPKLSNTKSAMLADEIATRLKIRNRWKVFEQFWNRHDMYKDNYEGRNQKQSLSFLDEIRTVLD